MKHFSKQLKHNQKHFNEMVTYMFGFIESFWYVSGQYRIYGAYYDENYRVAEGNHIRCVHIRRADQ